MTAIVCAIIVLGVGILVICWAILKLDREM